MAKNVPQLRTVGVIAAELGVPRSRASYLLEKLAIRPIGRAGLFRLFDQAAVEALRAELERMETKAGAVR